MLLVVIRYCSLLSDVRCWLVGGGVVVVIVVVSVFLLLFQLAKMHAVVAALMVVCDCSEGECHQQEGRTRGVFENDCRSAYRCLDAVMVQ